MQIGLTGGGSSVETIVRQAVKAEDDGFTSLWFPSEVLGDPTAAITVAGRETSTLEFGTSVLRTYETHPLLQAKRAAAVTAAIGAGRFTLGIGPSHAPLTDLLGLSYATAGRHTDEYVQIAGALLRGESVSFRGDELTLANGAIDLPDGQPVPLLVAALAPRLLRVAGQHADGTILWMANAAAIESHVAPRIRAAAEAAGRPAPRIVAGLPVAVTDDVAEARATAASVFQVYGTLPNYQRILAHGGLAGPAEAAIVGDEAGVAAQIEALFAAGATDVWAAPFPVGPDPATSRARTRAVLKELANS